MPTETPHSTSAQIVDNAARVDANEAFALLEIKRRLELDLPGAIGVANTRFGYTGANVIRTPEWVKCAPVGIKEGDKVNGILIGAAETMETYAPQMFKPVIQIVIYSVDQRVETEEQYLRHLQRKGLMKSVMLDCLTSTFDAQGRKVWALLTPSSSSWLPEEWEKFGGIQINYQMTHDPSNNTWQAV